MKRLLDIDKLDASGRRILPPSASSVAGLLRRWRMRAKSALKKRSACWVKRVLSVALLHSVFLVIRRARKTASPALYMALISNPVPDVQDVGWMVSLTLASFFSAFNTKRERIHLAVYAECSRKGKERVVPLDSTLLSGQHNYYMSVLQNSTKLYSHRFVQVNYYCSDSLGAAFCHASEKVLSTSKLDSLFLLEHDWMLLPSQITLTLAQIRHLLKFKLAYALLQRGDRARLERLELLSNIRRTDVYSNNPFFASTTFLRLVSLSSDACLNTQDARWERRVEKFCKDRDCGMYMLPTRDSGAALYHMDGRFASLARRHSVGPLFTEPLRDVMLSFLDNHERPEHIVHALDSYCKFVKPSRPKPECLPYFHRHQFSMMLKEHARRVRGQITSFKELVQNFTHDEPEVYLSGKVIDEDLISSMLQTRSTR